jgi:hypothetical protein
MNKRIVIFVAAAALWPSSAQGQSLLNAAGLGFPSLSVDARARALGGVGIGLRGGSLAASDPAAAAYFGLPTVMMTAQPSWVTVDRTDAAPSSSFKGTRFPLLGIAYPAFGLGTVTVSAESFIDQRFEARRPLTIDLGEGPVPATDSFVSNGGVSRVRLGFARIIGEGLAVGVSLGRYTGSVTRRLTRALDEDTTATSSGSFDPYTSGGVWGYSGTTLSVGGTVSVGSFAQVGASMTFSGALSAEASEDTDGSDRKFDVPVELNLGASAVLAPGLSLNAGLTRADWSGVEGDLEAPASAGSSLSFGAGLELSRARLFGRSAPIRLGYRRADLPFALRGDPPTESALTGGLGLALTEVGELVRAGVDLAIEKGNRTDGMLDEKFWRAALTLRLSGF